MARETTVNKTVKKKELLVMVGLQRERKMISLWACMEMVRSFSSCWCTSVIIGNADRNNSTKEKEDSCRPTKAHLLQNDWSRSEFLGAAAGVLFGAMADGLIEGSHANLLEADFCCDRGIVVIGSDIVLTSSTILFCPGYCFIPAVTVFF